MAKEKEFQFSTKKEPLDDNFDPNFIEKPKLRKQKNSPIVRLNITQDIEDQFNAVVDVEMSKIADLYEQEGYLDKVDEIERDLEGLPGFNEDMFESDLHMTDEVRSKLMLAGAMYRIIAGTGKRQTMIPRPIIIMEKTDDVVESELLRLRERKLDAELRKDIKYDEKIEVWYRNAPAFGSAVIKTIYDHKVEYRKKMVEYKPDDVGGDGQPTNFDFEQKYVKDILGKKKRILKYWEKLKNGETVILEEDEKVVIRHGANPVRVKDMKKFFARLDIKDFNDHIVVLEESEKTWYDIEQNIIEDINGETFYDVDKVEELRTEKGEKYAEETYKILEGEVLLRLEGEKKAYRFLVTFEKESKKFLRIIYKPYDINMSIYESMSPIPNDHSWLGVSLHMQIKDLLSTSESLLNALLKSYELAHLANVFTDDPNFDGGRVELNDLNVFKLEKGSTISTVRFDFSPNDGIAFFQLLRNLIDTISGVSVSQLSGQADPIDPRAPATKDIAQTRRSSIRIEDMVINMQKSDARICERIEKINFQFNNDNQDFFVLYDNGERIEVPKEAYNVNVDYVVQGSRMSFNKQLDLAIVANTEQILVGMPMYQPLLSNPAIVKALLEARLNNTGGTIEKEKEVFLEPLNQQLQLLEQARQQQEQEIEEARAAGATEEEINAQLTDKVSQAALAQAPQQVEPAEAR